MKLKIIITIRNIGIIAHIDAGKTTVTERILYYSGNIVKLGEVHDGNATMDWMPQERERGITITAAATQLHWKVDGEEYTINIIDTPGHVDFTIEVERSLRVLDGAVCVIDGVDGVQPQTITVWMQADKYKVPRIIFINKLDRLSADFYYAVQTLQDQLKVKTLILRLPVGKESDFNGCIDLITQEYYFWNSKSGDQYLSLPIPEEYMADVKKYRTILLETIIDLADEATIERYLATQELDQSTIYSLIRKGTIEGRFTPVTCGSAYKNIGVQLLLNDIVRYLPSPAEKEIITLDKTIKLTTESPIPCVLVFKKQKDAYAGHLYFVRIYTGSIKSGDVLYNPRTGKTERIGRMKRMHANKQEEIHFADTGDIVAFVGNYELITGDTLCQEKNQVLLEPIHAPNPVIAQKITPNTKDDQEKLSNALRILKQEDPSFHFSVEGVETIIHGMGELHLDIKKDILKREYKIQFTTGSPMVSYKETIDGEAELEYLHKKQTGGAGQYAGISMRIKPLPMESMVYTDPKKKIGNMVTYKKGEQGIVFIDSVVGGAIPKSFLVAVEDGIREAAAHGPLSGSPMVDLSIEVFDGKTHDVDSSTLAFQIAARAAVREILKSVKVILLEPIMEVVVYTPEGYMGSVIGDISSKRGQIVNIEDKQNGKEIKSKVPLAELFEYITKLREITQGKGSYTMSFLEYAIVPDHIIPQLQQQQQS